MEGPAAGASPAEKGTREVGLNLHRGGVKARAICGYCSFGQNKSGEYAVPF